MRVKLALFLIAFLAVTLVGCGSGSSSGGGGGNQRPTLDSISVKPVSAGINVGDTQQFKASGTYSDGSTKDITDSVTWSTSDQSVATITATGLATGVHGGQVTITAASGTLNNGTSLSVTAVLSSIVLSPSNPGVFVGASLQFAATGNYNDGTQKNLTSVVTWASSDTSMATINKAGLAAGIHGGSATISATSGSIQGSANLKVTALLNSIKVTPMGPAIQASDSEQFAAAGTFNDGTQADLTASASWSSSNGGVASIGANSGLAVGLAAGVTSIGASATSADGSIVTDSTGLHVVNTPPPNFSGQYAFLLAGADTRGNQYYAGCFEADGSGNISSGVEDANTGTGVATGAAIAGSYTVMADGRGTIVFGANAIHPNGLTLRFVLAAGASKGKVMEFDGAGSLKGEFEAVASESSLQAGAYVFLAGGADASGGKLEELGVFKPDGSGGITAGKLDINDAGTITTAANLVPTAYSGPDANSRGTLTISTGETLTQHFAYYMIDSSRINLIQLDAAPNSGLGGFAELQDSELTSTNSDLAGGFASRLEHPMLVGDVGLRGEFGTMGHLQFDGAGNLIDGVQDEHHDHRATYHSITGTFNILGSNARGVLTELIPSSQDETYVFYMVSTTKMFMLHTLNNENPLATPDAGVAQQQAEPFSNSTLQGSYALSGSELAQSDTEIVGVVAFDAEGAISGIEDVSQNGVLYNKILNVTYTSDVGAQTGRGEFGPAGETVDPLTDYLLYVISPDKAWSVGSDRPLFVPDTLGSLEIQ